MNGQVGGFSSGSREMAAVELRGRVAGTGLLAIAGKLNPTVKPLAMDITARATDIELAPLSAYSGKYAGYAIERGKLSVDVAYKFAPDGKLDASNQIILNQLTFGDKVESKDATKLPVLFAGSLLKDRHGVIDINLPVSGSISDPKFSIGGIIWKVIVNILSKAFTAPFAMLTGGGGGVDHSRVDFQPRTTAITPDGATTIDKVAKALVDRPALKMTVTGSADPVLEREAFQAATLEARLQAEQRREALRAGEPADPASAPPSLGAPQRAVLLTRLYKATVIPNKPRNALGFAKDIAPAEMEALLKPQMPVTDDAMRELALQRGLAVRDGLIVKGLPSERLFLAAPKLGTACEDAAAWTPRAQLALSTRWPVSAAPVARSTAAEFFMNTTIDTITLAGGCGWCLEADCERLRGVTAVESGYCNGHVPRPSGGRPQGREVQKDLRWPGASVARRGRSQCIKARTPPCAVAQTIARRWSNCVATSRAQPRPMTACKPTPLGTSCSNSRPLGATEPRTSRCPLGCGRS